MFREAFPIIYTDDVDSLVTFYVDAFGFELGMHWPAEGPMEYAFLRLSPLGIGIGRYPRDAVTAEAPPNGKAQFELWVYADDVDAAVERVCACGATLLEPAADQPWGERVAFVADPDGHPIHIGAALAPEGGSDAATG
ncbi:MAG TPA: VOC family protein [Candidatus Dormibacteraeota bacterium]|nr:VOC family protein [Candidatus Dormibacteraeota bacterium]